MSSAPKPEQTNRVPGLRGIEHIGITVPDLEQATTFFVEVLGCEPVLDSGPIRFAEGDRMTRLLDVHPRAVIHKMRHLRCGHGPNIELFQYSAPDQNMVRPKNSDMGGHHLTFYTDDFKATLDWLRGKNVRLLDGPNYVETGPNSGVHWIYFLAPWGLQMELVSYPNGRGYQEATERRLWHPAHPAR